MHFNQGKQEKGKHLRGKKSPAYQAVVEKGMHR
jgi:hypothetical protein